MQREAAEGSEYENIGGEQSSKGISIYPRGCLPIKPLSETNKKSTSANA